MKAKKVIVAVKPLEDALDEFRDVWRKAEAGEEVEKKEALYFESIRTLRSVLTERRLELLRVVREKQPASIKQLAEELGRDFKGVYRDIKLLASLGLVELEKGSGRIGARPRVFYDRLTIEVPV